ncbi:hypothetical protein Patl1_10140 [Pistacia atlantica]|uniref:Uncharacterized protein n=1 Tax=Pistacia atlantica TaxID=434234 RepID=A0ACC1A8B2_9ROSI|nr:hypothetical protein Patl1_10140 [Pistacia atlantica]
MVEKVFEALQPHPNLEILKIEGYKGIKFPVWMDYQILSNVFSITLSDLENCQQLPPLWQLPRLRCLTITNLINLEEIDTSSQGERKFPSLEELIIHNCPRLQRFSRQDGSKLFPSLTRLEIDDCPELTLPCLPSAKSLKIDYCNGELLKSISHFRSLTYLHLVSLSGLKSLTICQCPELEAFPEQVLEGLNSLRHLTLERCIKFSNLSEGLRHLSALESLTLNGCPELVTFPNGIKYLSSLRVLTICGKAATFFGDRKINVIFSLCLVVVVGEDSNCDDSNYDDSNCPKLRVLPESLRENDT